MSYADRDPLSWKPEYQEENDVPSIITTGQLQSDEETGFCRRKSYLTAKESVFIFSFCSLMFLVCLAMVLLLLLFVPFQ